MGKNKQSRKPVNNCILFITLSFTAAGWIKGYITFKYKKWECLYQKSTFQSGKSRRTLRENKKTNIFSKYMKPYTHYYQRLLVITFFYCNRTRKFVSVVCERACLFIQPSMCHLPLITVVMNEHPRLPISSFCWLKHLLWHLLLAATSPPLTREHTE